MFSADAVVVSAGGNPILEKGIVWSINPNASVPTDSYTRNATSSSVDNEFTINGNSYSVFARSLIYIRAYAKTALGTFYSSTEIVLDERVTVALGAITVSNITSNSVDISASYTVTSGFLPVNSITLYVSGTSSTTTLYPPFPGGAFSGTVSGLPASTSLYCNYHLNYCGGYYNASVSDYPFTTTSGVNVPSVTTDGSSGITSTGFSVSGTVTLDGGATVTERGVVIGTSANPTTSSYLQKVASGSGTGAFTSAFTGLSVGTTYHARAYGTNSAGSGYGADLPVVTNSTCVAATVTTTTPSSVTYNGAAIGGNATSDGGCAITERGTLINTTSTLTISSCLYKLKDASGGIGSFTVSEGGLSSATTYYTKAYAINTINGVQTVAYGSVVSFTTTSYIVCPNLTTTAITNLNGTTATSGGNITSDGGSAVTSRGVCWNTTGSPTRALTTKTSDGTGTGGYTSAITGLTSGTTYYVRAYATNDAGTCYGDEIQFTTLICPTMDSYLSDYASTTASILPKMTDFGGGDFTDYGICYSSTNTIPTTSDSKKSLGAKSRMDKVATLANITGLTPNTKYYYRAYGTNAFCTGYSSVGYFTTLAAVTVPSVTLNTASLLGTYISTTTTVTNIGNPAITERGVCYAVSATPTYAGSHTSDGSAAGDYTSTITPITCGVTYYIRAYVVQSGIAYYSSTLYVSSTPLQCGGIQYSMGGNLTSRTPGSDPRTQIGVDVQVWGCGTMTERGIYYSTSLPVTSGTKVIDSNCVAGDHYTVLTGLAPGTAYWIQGYFQSSQGNCITTYSQALWTNY